MPSELPQHLPPDINVEALLNYFPKGMCRLSLQGLHKRNTYNDIIAIEEFNDVSMHISVGRNSLYNSLPEYMFHPIDRFDNIPKYEEKERFLEQVDMQEEEISRAYQFFAPIDVLLLKLRADVCAQLDMLAADDIVLQQIIGDELTDAQRANRFIHQLLPFLPRCKTIRGNRTLLTLLLRKVFMEEGLRIDLAKEERLFSDEVPRYEQQLDMTLGEGYVGNTYTDTVTTFIIHYWSDEEAGEHFMQFIDDVEELRLFIKNYFLSVEEDLHFNICHDDPPLRLSDTVFYNFLNYNTNI